MYLSLANCEMLHYISTTHDSTSTFGKICFTVSYLVHDTELKVFPNPNPDGLFSVAALMLDYNDNGAVDITSKSHYDYYQLTTQSQYLQ